MTHADIPASGAAAGGSAKKLRSILDETGIRRALMRIAHEIVERNGEPEDLYLVAIPNGGVPLARMLAADLRERHAAVGNTHPLYVPVIADECVALERRVARVATLQVCSERDVLARGLVGVQPPLHAAVQGGRRHGELVQDDIGRQRRPALRTG